MKKVNFIIFLSMFFSGLSFSSTPHKAKDLFVKLSKEKFVCGTSVEGSVSFPKYEFDLKNNIVSSLYLLKHQADIFLVRCDSYDFNDYLQCEINASYEEKNKKILYTFIFQEQIASKKIELTEYSKAIITNGSLNHNGEQEFSDIYDKYQKGKYTRLRLASWYGPNELKKEFNGCSL